MTPSIDNVIISHILKFLAAFFLPLLPLLNVFLIEPIPRLTFKSLKLNLLTIYSRTVACIFTCTICFFFFLFKLQLPCMNLSFCPCRLLLYISLLTLGSAYACKISTKKINKYIYASHNQNISLHKRIISVCNRLYSQTTYSRI